MVSHMFDTSICSAGCKENHYYLNTLFYTGGLGIFFCIFFWRATVCRPHLCLCRPFMIFEGCLDRSQSAAVASWRATDLATHPS
jgi:hypothetical protein